MDDTEEPTNVFKFGQIKGDKEPEDKIPHNDYVVVTTDDHEFDVNGFLIFTPHHLAIMTDNGGGAIPALVMPIGNVRVAGLASLFDTEDDPPF